MRSSDRSKRRNKVVAFSLCVLVFLAAAQTALAGEAEQAFFNGNRLYERGDYSAAIAEYNRILDMGLESGNLYYNLGNAYLKMDRVADAILCYRRALGLMPRDGDLQSNLGYAELSIKDRFSPPRANFFMRSLNRLCSSVTVNEFLFLSSSLLILFWVIAIASLVLRRLKDNLKKTALAILILFLLSICLIGYKLWREDLHEEGIIMRDVVEVRYSPTEDGTVAFNLHKGSTVRIIRRRNGWVQISVPDGKSGWIAAPSIRNVDGKEFFDKNKLKFKVTKERLAPVQGAQEKAFKPVGTE